MALYKWKCLSRTCRFLFSSQNVWTFAVKTKHPDLDASCRLAMVTAGFSWTPFTSSNGDTKAGSLSRSLSSSPAAARVGLRGGGTGSWPTVVELIESSSEPSSSSWDTDGVTTTGTEQRNNSSALRRWPKELHYGVYPPYGDYGEGLV